MGSCAPDAPSAWRSPGIAGETASLATVTRSLSTFFTFQLL